MIFTELAPRPIQYISCHVRLSVYCAIKLTRPLVAFSSIFADRWSVYELDKQSKCHRTGRVTEIDEIEWAFLEHDIKFHPFLWHIRFCDTSSPYPVHRHFLYHVSHVTCHLSHVTCRVGQKVVQLVGGGFVILWAHPVKFLFKLPSWSTVIILTALRM